MSNTPHKRAREFEERHALQEEPWEYSRRAAEVARHAWVAGRVAALQPALMLDVGCSLGHITRRLIDASRRIVAIDLSPSAVLRLRALIGRSTPAAAAVEFAAASALEVPCREGTFDLVLASDGLHGWHLEPAERRVALLEMVRVARPGGLLLLTEHMHPRLFPSFLQEIREAPVQIEEVVYLHDRPWYQMASWFRDVRHVPAVQRILGSERLFRLLRSVGSSLGPHGSRHIAVLARRL